MRPGLPDAIVLRMADNTDWFEQLTSEEAKAERIIFGVGPRGLGFC